MKRNFWNACPRQLEFFPETSCPLGKVGTESKGDSHNVPCVWYVNSQPDHYCFWKWLRRTSNADGSFPPLLQHQISSLLKMSSTKINESYKSALSELKEHEEYQQLKELYRG